MTPKAIIWDFDGTLASSLAGITSSMREALAAHGFKSPTSEEVRATVGLTLEESMKRLTGGACTEEQVPILDEHYRSLHNSNAAPLTTVFDGVHEVLREARDRGIRSILVSNKGRKGLDQLLEQLKLVGYFADILSAQDVSYRKPDPRLFSLEIAARHSDLSPTDSLVVGDTEADLNFAKDAGLTSCWARYGYGNLDTCRNLRPNYVIESVRELWAVLEG